MRKPSGNPNTCYWELTRECDHACLHCRNIPEHSSPLPLHQALRLADEIASFGVRFVVLTGGEPTLYAGWEKIVQRLSASDVKVRLFLSGSVFDRDVLARAADSGVTRYSVSLDGPREIHDRIRVSHRPGVSSFEQARRAIDLITEKGTKLRVVTQVNRINIDHLNAVRKLVKEAGVRRWQVQLCQMSGTAARSRDALMLEPEDLHKVVSVLARANESQRIAPLHCTIGYMTEEEALFRGRGTGGKAVWKGCSAGLRTFSITPAGRLKGCVALPDSFVTASWPESSLEEFWSSETAFPYSRTWNSDLAAGHCAVCELLQLCRAGCPAVAYAATGSIGVNPYCLRHVRSRMER